VAEDFKVNKQLEAQMQLAQDVTSNVLALRRKVNIKVRQPLQTLLVPVVDADQRKKVESMAELIMSEVNVKEIKIVDNEESGLVKRVKADFKKLGPRYGKIMKQLGKAIQEMDQKQISELERNGQYTFAELPESPVVTTEDVEIIPEDVPGWLVANDGNITVALDVTVTDELRNEGMARELVNRIQNIRKSSDFEITDKVMVEITRNEQTDAAIQTFGSYISAQVLATEINIVDAIEDERGVELDIDGIVVKVLVVKK
jgi:isoleucyl-tRNA synthetase